MDNKLPDVKEALSQWFSVLTGQGVCNSGPMLETKSEALAKKLHHRIQEGTRQGGGKCYCCKCWTTLSPQS
jgi:hypothetical protein